MVYAHDGHLVEEQWWTNDTVTSRVLHTYDVNGRPASSMVIEDGGARRETERYRYDDTGRRTKVAFLSVPGNVSAEGNEISAETCGSTLEP